MSEQGDSSAPPPFSPESEAPPESINRRTSERFAVTWSVDCETEDTFLYASIANISEMGIFVRTTEPLPVGTELTLRFAPSVRDGARGPSVFDESGLDESRSGDGGVNGEEGAGDAFVLLGAVQWVNEVRPTSDNPNPGMGIRFLNLTPASRERIVEVVRTIAYLRDPTTTDHGDYN